ncbi:hypothetical protein AB205_0218390 [Aquarana catesbeiana]|uniref:Uncharacterized protein n=1 Tax=Aquarana catesbeiana TaxID=8400 RepID=A0A2G9RYT3_AQUCT|nr:hypothetical protein AB205_0218390 [Aquarana catesbeiana]
MTTPCLLNVKKNEMNAVYFLCIVLKGIVFASTEGLEHLSVFIAVYVTVREIPPLFVLFTVIIERISSHFLFGYGTRSEGKWDTDGEKMF